MVEPGAREDVPEGVATLSPPPASEAPADPLQPGEVPFGTHDVLPPLDGGPMPAFATGADGAEVTSTAAAPPVLRAVRTGGHDGFDRIVFEFDSAGLPQWHVASLQAEPADCGSGAEVALKGDAVLQVRFSGARAHTEAGTPTSGPRRRGVDLPVVREIVRTCDFEAEVTWVAGLAAPRPHRTFVLEDPARLVVDVQH